MNVLDVLIAARAEVEKGWCQHALFDTEGNCCALGALYRAPGNFTAVGIDGLAGLDFEEVVEFNNAPETTQSDVLALFDRAINAEVAKAAPTTDPAHVHTVAA